ncbi:hypothetical protein CERSUDRAFT_80183 [Gelatoporia subvermispora B]|uniref:TRP C-terminal domain-containing protein n=1 Tax=Ceriporiopsis subvermispora (strain B) TaxID=914234 RepID=M2RQ03_CERS8|nr:hypothetical protein CERSUDRAFT_80183 [Gelatoporia subvermispora B]
MLLVLCLSLSQLTPTFAQPATLQYSDCFSDTNTSVKLNISNVYAQLLPNESGGPRLNFTVLGETPATIVESSPADNDPENVVATTLFTTTEMLTFDAFNNGSFFCQTLRSTSANNSGQCPIPPGPFAFSSAVNLPSGYELLTFDTRLRALDPLQTELLCIDLTTTALKPGAVNSVYGHAKIIFWCTISLAIAYWLLIGLARLASAWGRGSTRTGTGLWARVESAGFILASAISGERLATSPALMRFCTPSLRDIIFHTQWCAALSMVAVQWPTFVYPIFAQTAWSMLSYNITVTQGRDSAVDHWNPLTVAPFDPPADFAEQLSNQSSPIFIDTTVPNVLFQLPDNATSGITSYAWTVGLRPRDLFGICLTLFLAIIAATIVLSVLVWGIDWLAALLSSAIHGSHASSSALAGNRSPRYSMTSKDLLDTPGAVPGSDENRSLNGHFLFRTTSRFPTSRPWWKLRTDIVSFHGSVLQGNLVRILMFFHLPVTIFSCYQMTMGRDNASLASIILAAISFAVFSVLLPIFLILRLTLTNTTKLYDETWTLLSLGPLYNHYRHGSQLFACLLFATNIAFGITIGCGQRSGTAQAIIILVIEVVSALGTSIWLPWGQGASMGLISFLFCVARIVIAVLLVILTPIVSIDTGAAQWVAYAILFILGLIYLAFVLMLVVKLVEATVRIFGGIGFHRSRSAVDSGLLGTLGMLGCCGARRPPPRRGRAHPNDIPKQPSTLLLPRQPPPRRDGTPSSPPSVLRPEHALQPYREESDDETGYIMGAWQPFPGPGYTAVEETPEQPKVGFARVGGGRAHYETPYAIASSSTHTFPSVERNVGSSSLAQPPSPIDYSPPPTPSVSSAAKRADISLPPSAMPPAHVRTKSQTAIIENLVSAQPLAAQLVERAQEAVPESAVDDLAPTNQPKKNRWYNRRKPRRMSEGDVLDSVPNSSPDPGRSFVVVRKQRPGLPPKEGTSSSANETTESAHRSFEVLRGSNNDPSTS